MKPIERNALKYRSVQPIAYPPCQASALTAAMNARKGVKSVPLP